MKIAVAGHRGRLGSWLVKQGFIAMDCDAASPDQVAQQVDAIQPDCIVNCAAFTDVDGAERAENEDAAIRANMHVPFVLRRAFPGLLVHISTGFVFDGKNGPYSEDAEPNPVNFYGMSKLGGEAAAMMREPTLVVRVLDLFGVGPHTDFVFGMRRILRRGDPMLMPDDLFGTPTYIPHLAKGISRAIDMSLTGIIHIGGSITISRLEWARMIADHFGYSSALFQPTSYVAVDGKAERPPNAGLDTSKAEHLGIPIFHPIDGLRALTMWEQRHGQG